MEAGLAIGFVLLVGVVIVVAIIAKLVVVGNPNEMLIITGRQHRDGSFCSPHRP